MAEPAYTRATRIYLDQNVISNLADGKLPGLMQRLTEANDTCVVWSFPHLDEIGRLVDPARKSRVLGCLKTLRACWLEVNSEGVGQLKEVAPETVLANWSGVPSAFPDIDGTTQEFGYLLTSGAGSQEIASAIGQYFSGIMGLEETLMGALEEARAEQALGGVTSEVLVTPPEDWSADLRDAGLRIGEILERAKEELGGRTPVAAFREVVGADPRQLNNVRGPDVVGNMLMSLRPNEEMAQRVRALEDFRDLLQSGMFGAGANPFQKVVGGYTFLSFLGFFPDDGQETRYGYRKHLNDGRHVGCAAFCHKLLSGDMRLFQKAGAVYEALQIGTNVELVRVECSGRVGESTPNPGAPAGAE